MVAHHVPAWYALLPPSAACSRRQGRCFKFITRARSDLFHPTPAARIVGTPASYVASTARLHGTKDLLFLTPDTNSACYNVALSTHTPWRLPHDGRHSMIDPTFTPNPEQRRVVSDLMDRVYGDLFRSHLGIRLGI